MNAQILMKLVNTILLRGLSDIQAVVLDRALLRVAIWHQPGLGKVLIGRETLQGVGEHLGRLLDDLVR